MWHVLFVIWKDSQITSGGGEKAICEGLHMKLTIKLELSGFNFFRLLHESSIKHHSPWRKRKIENRQLLLHCPFHMQPNRLRRKLHIFSISLQKSIFNGHSFKLRAIGICIVIYHLNIILDVCKNPTQLLLSEWVTVDSLNWT